MFALNCSKENILVFVLFPLFIKKKIVYNKFQVHHIFFFLLHLNSSMERNSYFLLVVVVKFIFQKYYKIMTTTRLNAYQVKKTTSMINDHDHSAFLYYVTVEENVQFFY